MQPIRFTLPLLEMGTMYEYELFLNGRKQKFPYPLEFQTMAQWEWRTDPPDFSFLFGSCGYINDAPYDRPGTPYGKGTEIYRTMAATGADFMIWGGDNLYLRESDFSSESGIWYRYSKNRSTTDVQKLLAVMHHYATCDDHDYSSNDGNKSYEFKAVPTEAFQTYWSNPTWGLPELPGVHGKFLWGDAAFIVMDNRTYRDDSNLDPELYPGKTQYGPEQLEWLKQSLLHVADFKDYQGKPLYPYRFIVTGNQFLATVMASADNHANYPHDRQAILDFIEENQLEGVFFLTGDVHHTGFYKIELEGGLEVYDLTSSAMSSGPWSDVTSTPKANDPALIEDTLVGANNFCKVSLSGSGKDRTIRVQCFNPGGEILWERTIGGASK
jgi:alkaline phosphatase D